MNDYDTTDLTQDGDGPSMWEYLSDAYDFAPPSRGDIREGTILSLRRDQVVFDIGAKQDALLSSRELDHISEEEFQALHLGDQVNVYVLRADESVEQPIVSLRLAKEQEDWIRAQAMMDSGELTHSKVTGFNKGGLLSEFGGLQGFIPISQIANLVMSGGDRTQAEMLGEYVGRELVLKVIEVNRRRRRLILSERAAMREWRSHQREQLLEEIAEGQTRTGVVSNLVDFGAFVDLGGMDGLVHISELSWGRVEHPREVLNIGQEVEVLILNVDRDRQRIGLSIKRIQRDPWESVGDRYEAGQLVVGVVSHIVSFGAFVELEPGVEGLVHVSELADGQVENPADLVRENQELTLLVLGVDPQEHRISLSLRQAPRPEPDTEASAPPDEAIDMAEDDTSEEPPVDDVSEEALAEDQAPSDESPDQSAPDNGDDEADKAAAA